MATIKDVARLAGVGLGTASRAISGRGPVSEKALARVNEAVAALQFRPSNVARALTSKTLGMVGIYVPDFAGTFYGQILQTVDRELRAVDRHMVAANGCGAGDERQQALDGVRFLYERGCDGVIVMSNALTDDDFSTLFERYPTLVLLNRSSRAAPQRCFSTDHELGGRLAARALLQRGHREIAFIGGPHSAPDNEQRMAGFLDELARHEVRVPKRRRIDADFSFEGGYAAAGKLARAARDYSALFCANDVMAMAAISCLGKLGVSVPGEVSVLGFDNCELSRFTAPALTTVSIPIVDAATSACRFLLNQCYELSLPVGRAFPPDIVWRDSVGVAS
ncbi:MAG TPA: substrate-binding domain-containing protein [Albitalea sp.]|uniref:substrate-binding domain-containing protein n=1 Tax=Piscinibacter sp. TaxID=1903157 RepID=UPI002ED0AC54